MATLILGTAGRAFGGPIGGLIGTIAGGFIDRAILGGGGAAREGPRLSNLAVQSAAYGEPIPHIHGRLRVAGNIVWTAGIRETVARSGGGKRGPATTNYSYSASFAVALCGRAIAGIGRIWADGKVIRDASGAWITPVTMRLHGGGEGQAADPLIASAEAAGTPAYRGMAYAVFEDLPLADYGNRIPNLTFEVIADEGAMDAGVIAAAMARAAGVALAVSGDFPAVGGHVAARAGSLAAALEPLVALSGARLTPAALRLRGDEMAALAIDSDDCDAVLAGTRSVPERRTREAADTLPDVLEIGYFDPALDYQAGLQRARRGAASGRVDHRDLPMAFDAAGAKAIAEAGLARAALGQRRHSVRLGWRHAAIDAGDRISLEDASVWRVRERRFENFVQTLDLEACAVVAAVAVTADSGRGFDPGDSAAGPTVLHVFELPPLAGPLPQQPRVWIAAAGPSPGWRRADVEISSDGGSSYAPVATIGAGTVLGSALTVLPPGPRDRWDAHASVDVELLADAMWLEGRTPDAVLAGGNLALIGDELVQFVTATAIGSRRFRLSGLLRGRRGSEAAIAGHAAGEGFVLIEPERLGVFDAPAEMIGRRLIVRAAGMWDAVPVTAMLPLAARALRPLPPAALRAVPDAGGLRATWRRRSRAGFGWTDFADAPLGEDSELYRLEVRWDGIVVRTATAAAPAFDYSAAMATADGVAGPFEIAVAQIGAQTGPGGFAVVSAAFA